MWYVFWPVLATTSAPSATAGQWPFSAGRVSTGDSGRPISVVELGATVAQANPLCTVCPVVEFCAGAANGTATELQNGRKAAIRWKSTDSGSPPAASCSRRIPQDANNWPGNELPRADAFAPKLKAGTLLIVKSRGITNKRIKERVYAPCPAARSHAPGRSGRSRARARPDHPLRPAPTLVGAAL